MTHSDDLRPAATLTGTYFPPKGKHLHLASPDEFVSFLVAYSYLWLARREAFDQGLHPYENPITVAQWYRFRVRDPILLWMWYQGHVGHCLSKGDGAHFENCPRAADLLFSPGSAFWLTDDGDVFAESFVYDAFFPREEGLFEATWRKLLLGQLLPTFDSEDRVFRWGARLLKCFHQPAKNQELVLRAEEELDWPSWMDDPLTRMNGKNPKVRMHDTIKDLNRRLHEPGLVHFQGDGTGSRIGWQYPQCVAQAMCLNQLP